MTWGEHTYTPQHTHGDWRTSLQSRVSPSLSCVFCVPTSWASVADAHLLSHLDGAREIFLYNNVILTSLLLTTP